MFARIEQAAMVPHSDVVLFVRERRLHGRGIGWIDVHLLVSAIVGRFQLWTAEGTLATVAEDLGVGYESLEGKRGKPS